MANVTLKHIAKTYDNGFEAVKDFNIEIGDKEFIILVGPSGCGKSTTLRMIAGLEDISSGELEIDGVLVNDVPAKDRDIAMVFQNYALYPHMTVYENMAFALKMRKASRSEIDQKVREAAKILEIDHLLDRKPKALSGGQRQRVALGRAIVRHPKVFLMDEPLSNLDAKLRVQMRVQITRLHQQLRTTFIYVTHDQTEAMTMGTRIVVMKDGVIQQIDSPKALYNHPANLFVAGFIGMPPMNFIDGVLRAEADGDIAAELPSGERIRLSRRYRSEAVRPHIGRPVVLGIRPESIYDHPQTVAQLETSALDVGVDVAEMLGAETYLYLSTPWGQSLTARVDPKVSQSQCGDRIRVALDPDRVHVFDRETEQAVING